MDAATVQQQLEELADEARAISTRRYFKTGPGEYGEGDQFRGIRIPTVRQVAKQHRDLPLSEVERLLHSPYHEDRLVALVIMTLAYARGDEATRQAIYQSYLGHTARINNWDLVDISAGDVVGAHLWDKDRSVLDRLARSTSLWERRIAIIATFYLIQRGEFADTLRLAETLLHDREDLMHKAVGWMLREVGNRDLATEEGFLQQHYQQMPRTMLRYAIEKFPEPKRQAYLKGQI